MVCCCGFRLTSFEMILRCVPFVNWDEWILVKNGLFSQLLHEKDQAVRRVEVWRIRGNVPHSVDLTAQLVDIRNQDPQYNDTISSNSSSLTHSTLVEHLRLLYSIIIIRAVNGIVEPNQTTYFAQSILTIAERLGLPGWIVELRHDATHKQLPSLSVLRAASDYLLNWYHQNYWQPQEGLLQSLTASCIPIKFLHQSSNSMDSSENTKTNNELWYKTLQKNAVSPSFLMEIFLPFFTSIITKISWEEEFKQISENESIEKKETGKFQQIFQKFIKQQLSIWKAPLHCLLPVKDNWLHACLCRLLHLATQELESHQTMTSFTLEFVYKIKIILFWCKYLIELYYLPPSEYVQRSSERKKKKNKSEVVIAFPEVLVMQRKKFIQTMKIELEIKSNSMFNQLDKSDINLLLELVDSFYASNNINDERLTVNLQKVTSATFLSIEENLDSTNKNDEKDEIMIEDVDDRKEVDDESPTISSLGKRTNQRNQSEQAQKRIKSIETNSSSSSSVPTIDYVEYVKLSSLPGIRRCHDFPVWPLGLRPGRYECDDLSQLEEISIEEDA